MRLVADASARPSRCALIPFVGGSQRTGFFDAGTELGGEHVYVSFTAFKEMARIAGYVPAGPSLGDQERAGLRAQVEQRDAEIASLREQLGAVEVLKQAGFTQARKPGRPPKVKEAV